MLLALTLTASAEPERFLTVWVKPPEAVFDVRRADNQVPLGRGLASGTEVVVKGPVGSVTIHVKHPGYQEVDRSFPLVATPGPYWVAGNRWTIPLELVPSDASTMVMHQLRFHPALPLGLLGVVGLAGAGLMLWHWRRLTISRQAEARARQAQEEAETRALQLDPDLTGRQVGDYQVAHKLGEGGFAQVYVVKHKEYGDRFALKILKRELLDEEMIGRLHREMEIGCLLTHPNLVRILAFGDYHEAPYLVMDLVEGEQLNRLITRSPMSPVRALGLFKQMCEGVAFAHNLGIIHRDLKPENMMLTRAGVLKVLDFGVARRQDHERLTLTGETLGTPTYMAPEQLNGRPGIGSDIYSLGIILFRMLSGRLPFEAPDNMSMITAHLNQQPPDVRRYNDDVSEELAQLVADLLIKEPLHRPQKLEFVLARLEGMGA